MNYTTLLKETKDTILEALKDDQYLQEYDAYDILAQEIGAAIPVWYGSAIEVLASDYNSIKFAELNDLPLGKNATIIQAIQFAIYDELQNDIYDDADIKEAIEEHQQQYAA